MTLTTAFMPALDDGLVTSEDPVDPAVRPQRRRFTAAFKVEVLAAYDAATGPGEKGALLRKHGLYSSHLVEWRKAQQAGALAGLNGLPRPAKKTTEQLELEKLRRVNGRLERELAKNKAALTIMGKAHELLELLSESSATEAPPTR